MPAKPRLSGFKPQARNANKHTQRGLGMLDKSMGEDGWIGAVTTAADGETFDGSARLETAYTRFGSEVEPIVVETDGTRPVIVKRTDIASADDPRAKKLAIAANRIAQVDLEWDAEVLAELDEEINLGDFWGEDELALLLPKDLAGGDDDPDTVEDNLQAADAGELESRVKPGEVWQIGRHRICCADSTDERLIKGLLGAEIANVSMVWSDPPYGISVVSKDGSLGGSTKGKYSQIIGDDTKEIAYKSFELYNRLFPVSQCWWGANHYASVIGDSSCWVVWDKQDGKSVTFADCELAWTNLDSPARVFTHVWDGFRRDSEIGVMRVHPTQKPIALFEWFFEKYGSSNDLIVDPFLGSGGSVIAAQKMEGSRTVYGFEVSPQYCEVILRRWEEFTGVTAYKISDIT